MTDVLDRYEALERDATPGPVANDAGYIRAHGKRLTLAKMIADSVGYDGDLIAASRNTVPAVIALAKAAQEVTEAAARFGGANDLIKAHFKMERALDAFLSALSEEVK